MIVPNHYYDALRGSKNTSILLHNRVKVLLFCLVDLRAKFDNALATAQALRSSSSLVSQN